MGRIHLVTFPKLFDKLRKIKRLTVVTDAAVLGTKADGLIFQGNYRKTASVVVPHGFGTAEIGDANPFPPTMKR